MELPDWNAQAKAAQQFMELTGLADLPVRPEDENTNPVDQILDRLPDDALVELDRLMSEIGRDEIPRR